ncbi:hypothetical protein, partial [Staphylococcus hominis]|uniref:hypothetical protein n=2 Tax=Bacillati TaxID=1783272 RepID=UPI001C92F74E
GVFPRPDASAEQFTSAASALPGVTRAVAGEPTKTSFASYDVTATVTAAADLPPDQRRTLVDGLSDSAAHASGNGV